MSSPRAPAVAAVFALQILLLSTGVWREYRLKHEDNNALHATFARAHLRLGLDATHAQNYFYSPSTGRGLSYPNHPPGPALALAVTYGLTGSDGPLATRLTAIAFHLAGTWLFYLLARRVLRRSWEVLLSLLLYAVLPESAFFGRMMNHEVMVLPAVLLLVLGAWEAMRGTWPVRRWVPAVVAGTAGAAVSGWAGFFGIFACALYAAHERFARHNPRAAAPLAAIVAAGAPAAAAVFAHLMWGGGTGSAYLVALFASRSGGLLEPDLPARAARLLELHWRYFGLTSLAGLLTMAFRIVRARGALRDPADDIGAVFLLAGAGYVWAFSLNATRHDYWQFLLLPASVLGIVLALRWLQARVHDGTPRRFAWRALIAFAALDITATSAITLVQRHTKGEAYCIEVAARLERDYL